jgi:hypothetical protein
MIIIDGVIAFAITYFMLRKNGGVGRHVAAFFVAALVAIILSFVTFELIYSSGGLYSEARYKAQPIYIMSCLVAAVVGPITGMLAAKFARRKKLRQQTS